ncbi:MAG: hypothetical protein E6Q88_00300 [Lysobacteraceae bacterium]|nr:MAG: hypothetical protein E6Q88_00300 [Xanthomonadaceae bacterium]
MAALALIAVGGRVAHSGASLRDHLIGTYEILCRWGAAPDVCIAGLMHSVYSTQYFTTQILSPALRRQVAAAVGARAERIAHLFCRLDRVAIRASTAPAVGASVRLPMHGGGGSLRVPRLSFDALRLIDIANEIEQRQRQTLPQLPWLAWASAGFAAIGFEPKRLGDFVVIRERDEHDALRHYRAALEAGVETAHKPLQRCVERMPRCAEPRILLSLRQLQRRRFDAAYANASQGESDLLAWGAAWDPRIPFTAWRLLAAQIADAARAASSEPPALGMQVLERLRDLERSVVHASLDPA